MISSDDEREEYKGVMIGALSAMLLEYWQLPIESIHEVEEAVGKHFMLYGAPSIKGGKVTLAELFEHEDEWALTFEEE